MRPSSTHVLLNSVHCRQKWMSRPLHLRATGPGVHSTPPPVPHPGLLDRHPWTTSRYGRTHRFQDNIRRSIRFSASHSGRFLTQGHRNYPPGSSTAIHATMPAIPFCRSCAAMRRHRHPVRRASQMRSPTRSTPARSSAGRMRWGRASSNVTGYRQTRSEQHGAKRRHYQRQLISA